MATLAGAERNESWRLVLRDGALVGHGSGLIELSRAIALTRPLSHAIARVPESVLDRLYSALSSKRDFLAHVVPNGPAPRRFP